MDLASLRICADSPKPSLLDNVMSTKISSADSYIKSPSIRSWLMLNIVAYMCMEGRKHVRVLCVWQR